MSKACAVNLNRAATKAKLGRVGGHTFRHTFASHLVMKGANIKAVQELLGHASLQMTMRYSHLSPNVVRDTIHLLESPCQGNNEATTIRQTSQTQ